MAIQPDTAILLFSRTAQAEAAAKTFSHHVGRKGNLGIARRLIQHSQKIAQDTGLPIFTSFSTQQIGESFGERLAHAMKAVYRQGFQKVIVIGNDCPALTAKKLIEVYRRLKTAKIVLGPATDGGVYLIGIDRAAFYREKLLALPWERNNLQHAFSEYAKCITWLAPLADIDQAKDFHFFLNRLPHSSRLKRVLGQIIAGTLPVLSSSEIIIPTLLYRPILSLRAPPF